MTSTPEQPDRATAAQPRATTADHKTQVQALARYAARATFDDLSADSRGQLPIHILDSLACCIAVSIDIEADLSRAQVHPAARCESS